MLNTPLEVLPDTWQITLPLPFELLSVNVYLIQLVDGYMLLDCGLLTPESFEELSGQLAHLGVSFHEIREIVLTHTHPDHVGQAQRLLKLTGAKLRMSSDEHAQLLRIARPDHERVWLAKLLALHGVGQELTERIVRSFGKVRPNFAPLDPDSVLKHGDVLETAIGGLEVRITPGHSPGHCCLYNPEHDTLFSGDHILQTITPHIGWLSGRDALEEYLTSLDQVNPLHLEKLLPGHGAPFCGHREWIAATRAHHDNRCEHILAALRSGPRTAHEIVGVLWPHTLAPFHHRFAIFEVLSHLEYLRRRDKIREEADEQLVRWRV